MKKTIKVATPTVVRDADVLATRGVWAAHLTLYTEKPLGDLTITHVPTGLAFLRDLPSLDAARAVMLLLPARWGADLKPVKPGAKISRRAARSSGWYECALVQRAVRSLHDGWDEVWS